MIALSNGCRATVIRLNLKSINLKNAVEHTKILFVLSEAEGVGRTVMLLS
jgi:hypothetical protein